MEAVAHDPGFAKKAGIPQKVGQDYALADIGRKLGGLPETVKKPKKGKR
jgi:hypothetical protein